MADPNSILAITQPKLEIRKISQLDVDALNSPFQNQTRPSAGNLKTRTGLINPYLEMDNYIIPGDRLISLNIFQNGFLPEIQVTFLDTTGAFSGMYFPRTNPILKVYIKSLSPALKPVRNDYLITNISNSEYTNLYSGTANIETVYTLTGKLYIPGIYGNNVQSIPKKKSWEALKSLADLLKLGFATNETSTDDKMTWLNPNNTVENFIKDICSRAYKNEKSFFDCFIDTNYILNFINYEKSLSKDTNVIQVPIDATGSQYSEAFSTDTVVSKDDKEKETGLIDVLLSSSSKKIKTGFNIVHYAMHSDHGEILANQSFRKSITWHDRSYWLNNKELINHFIEPLSEKTINFKETVYQKPKPKNFAEATESSIRWMGLDYNNSHTNYKFSRLLNSHNLDELCKNYLIIKLPGLSQTLYRGGKVDVLINRFIGPEKSAILPDEKNPASSKAALGQDEQTDIYLTGPYVVKDIIYGFNGAPEITDLKYYTELVLVRREWIEVSENNKLESEKTN